MSPQPVAGVGTAPAPVALASAATTVPVLVFVGIGANLGDAKATLVAALEALRELASPRPPGTSLTVSSFWRTAPVDALGPDFLNAVARFETLLSPHGLLQALQAIELRFGRERPYRHAPRTLDLDLLLYAVDGAHGGLRLADEILEIPHPRAGQRRFVMEPLAELWPDGEIPGRGRVGDLLAATRADGAQRVARLPD